MALQEVTSDGSVLIVPASSVSITVATQPSGFATSGVIAIVGEAEEGPAWNDPGEKLSANSFAPTNLQAVQAKYGSGRLVDGFANMGAPSTSPKVAGAPNRIITVKTNSSTKASSTNRDGSGSWLAARGGLPGNLINYSISQAVSESAPTTGSFSYVPSASSSSLALRVNGGSRQDLSISADETPTALASALTGLSNINAVGGVDRNALAGLTGQNISLSVVSGQTVNITLAAGQVFAAQPQVGDTLRIPTGSVIAGAGDANVGWYLVIAVSNTTAQAQITALKVTAGAPANVSPTAISATPTNDLNDYSYMKIDDMSGTNRNILTGLVSQNVTVSASSSNLTATLAAGQIFASSPQVGDIMYIPGGSAFQGAGNANVGWYQVTATSNTLTSAFITAARLSNGTPVSVATTPIVAVTDLQDYDPQIDGDGKALEIYDSAGSVNISTIFFNLGTTNPASWLSGATPNMLTSSAELEDGISVVRSSTNSSESYTLGGNIVMTVGYQPSSPTGTATLTISKPGGVLTLTTSVSGGPGSNLSVNLTNVPTINDLVNIINSNPGYKAAAFTSAAGLRSVTVLDQVTSIGICSENGGAPGRIKSDIYDLTKAQGSLASSKLITYTASATAGLPDAQPSTFLQGGLRGGTTGLQFANAIQALQAVVCNFVVPLISQDASRDITAGQTDGSSTYQVDAVNALARSHVLSMSTPKIKRNRLAVVSKEDTFANQMAAAQNMSNFRVAMCFQDMIQPSASTGNNVQYQPWMSACVAAAYQAAAFSKTIFNKGVNCSGVLQADGSFDDGNLTDLENALLAGLLPLQTLSSGGVIFASDQTTYSVDQNFVYNSLQAVYVADLIAVDLANSLQTAFVGEVTADVTPTGVTSFIKSKMRQYLQLKLTAATTANPTGWVTINVDIAVPVMTVKVVAVESTGIYFIPISLVIEGVQS